MNHKLRAEFVNYKKRSFTLPPGCKNLIDVLQLSRRQKKGRFVGGFQLLELREERFPTCGLAQIGRYVSMLLQSQRELFSVSITAQNFQFPVTLYRTKSERTVVIVLVTKEAGREQSIRAFFEQQGLQPLLDERDLAGSDATRGLAYPLPLGAERATSVTTELLRSVYDLSDEAGLDFRYYDMETAA